MQVAYSLSLASELTIPASYSSHDPETYILAISGEYPNIIIKAFIAVRFNTVGLNRSALPSNIEMVKAAILPLLKHCASSSGVLATATGVGVGVTERGVFSLNTILAQNAMDEMTRAPNSEEITIVLIPMILYPVDW